MIAFVLSGGANRGPLETGALQSLVAHNITADFVVGTSAGALNGVYYAYDPTPAGMQKLAEIWINTKVQEIFPNTNRLAMAWRVLIGRDSLVDGNNFLNTIQKYLPGKTFADLKIPFYSVTADLMSAQMIVFGDDKSIELLEPVAASASFPIVLPPIEIDDFQLSDGGVTAIVPIQAALDRGATELYVIDLEPVVAKSAPVHGVLNIAMQTLMTALRTQLITDLKVAIKTGMKVHHVNITAFPDLDLFDFSQAARLVEVGRLAMDTYLNAPRPNVIRPLSAAAQSLPRVPRGGRAMRQ
jgi:NTE family protein